MNSDCRLRSKLASDLTPDFVAARLHYFDTTFSACSNKA